MTSNPLYFPIASCPPSKSPGAAAYDRRWLVVDADGRWLAPKDNPRLAEIDVETRFGYLVVRAPGMLRMDLPLDVIEDDDSVRRQATVGKERIEVVDEGDLAATWLTNFLQTTARLVKIHPDQALPHWPDVSVPQK